MLKLIISAVIASWLVVSEPLYAQVFYADGALGNASTENDDLEGDDTYYRLGGGYDYTDTFAVETGYWDMGEAEDGIFNVSADGLYLAMKGMSKTSDKMHLFVRIGLYKWDSTLCAAGFDCVDNDGSDPFFGGGIGFAMDHGTFNVELHLFELDDVDVKTIGASYTIPFGK